MPVRGFDNELMLWRVFVVGVGGSPETTYGPCQRVRAAGTTEYNAMNQLRLGGGKLPGQSGSERIANEVKTAGGIPSAQRARSNISGQLQ